MRCRVLLPTGKQALTYVKVHSSFEDGGGGGRRVEQRDSLELLGEGCDHSVIEHYCRIPHTHARVQCT